DLLSGLLEEQDEFADKSINGGYVAFLAAEKVAQCSEELCLRGCQAGPAGAAQRDGDATGEDGFGQRLGLVAREQQKGIIRRFLEGFEEGIGGLDLQAIGL